MDYSQVEKKRFFESFDASTKDDCWEWKKGILKTGYGAFYMQRGKRKTFNSHRVSWEIHNSAHIPRGGMICHTCDNRKCVNPNHLYLGNSLTNNRDTIARNRGNRAIGNNCSWTKIPDEDIMSILKSSETQTVLAAKYGVHQSTISDIKRGKRRSSVSGLSLKSRELLEHPKSRTDYNIARNGKCDSSKTGRIGQSAAEPLSQRYEEGSTTNPAGCTSKWMEAREELI